MYILLILSFNLFAGSSIPLSNTQTDIPSGFSAELTCKYYINYSFLISDYRSSNNHLRIYGFGLGREFKPFNRFSILPEFLIMNGIRGRGDVVERGFFPMASIRLSFLFPSNEPQFQVGFSLKEVFNEEIDSDFFDIGFGFWL